MDLGKEEGVHVWESLKFQEIKRQEQSLKNIKSFSQLVTITLSHYHAQPSIVETIVCWGLCLEVNKRGELRLHKGPAL